MTLSALATQVKQRLSGDTPNMSSDWDAVIESVVAQVGAEINREIAKARGIVNPWAFTADSSASERFFSAAGIGRRFVSIDDCVAVTAVRTLVRPGTASTTLVAGTDYIVGQSMPIVGLYNLSGEWPDTIYGIGVTAKWGYATTQPTDVDQCIVIESIREFLAAKSGMDDKVGSHVFGTVVISKAFTAKTQQMIQTYGYGGAQARG
jgi:hypothetical protein